jgi:hypothetical protein
VRVIFFIVGQEGAREELAFEWGVCLSAKLAPFSSPLREKFAHFVGDRVQHNEYLYDA